MQVHLDELQCYDTGLSRLDMIVAEFCPPNDGFYVQCNTSNTAPETDPSLTSGQPRLYFNVSVYAINPEFKDVNCSCPAVAREVVPAAAPVATTDL